MNHFHSILFFIFCRRNKDRSSFHLAPRPSHHLLNSEIAVELQMANQFFTIIEIGSELHRWSDKIEQLMAFSNPWI